MDRRDFCLRLGAMSGLGMLPAGVRALGMPGQTAPGSVAGSAPGAAQASLGEKTSAVEHGRLQWWREARFGMMIHWGLYAIPGRGEWVQFAEQIPVRQYATLAQQFNPTDFHAEAWASLARDAGMKYTVLTARHHDGFALFDDPDNPFTSVSTAARRDLIDEYARAVRRAGLHVGLYYSPLDWRFPGFFFPDLQLENAEQMRAQYHRQIEILATKYGEIDVLWFDGGESDWLSFGHDMSSTAFPKRKGDYHGQFSWRGDEVNAMLRSKQPQVIVNNRAAGIPPDYHSREWTVGSFDNTSPWECAFPLAGYWGYSGDTEPMALKDAIQLLVNVVGRDGNLLMNIGPRADGTIVPSHEQRLREMGQWVQKYGESIYGTRGGPFMPGKYGVSTHKANRIYVHVLDAAMSRIALPPIPGKVVRSTCLTGEAVRFTQNAASLDLILTRNSANQTDAIVVLDLDRHAHEIPVTQVG
ncbi:alpha-L-fucosidase [Acidobacterium capsulatum ATCC 51196]|uniref:alpha-L-fucosidase n=2 Tax=Acidobacteriaceae TaxID=204434 RepID=C1F2W5_ACIC5|nr:alpha-L-fucosidase [Acidobacterium capsulatum ATCC 51196]